jgi:molybdate transport system regulatory protein
MKFGSKKSAILLPRFRVIYKGEAALGPGKAVLLSVVSETGSLLSAAKKINMSYMRAWQLVKAMNACFKEPLIELRRGGKTGGGAVLTQTGERVLTLYRQLETQAEKATRVTWRQLKPMLKDN